MGVLATRHAKHPRREEGTTATDLCCAGCSCWWSAKAPDPMPPRGSPRPPGPRLSSPNQHTLGCPNAIDPQRFQGYWVPPPMMPVSLSACLNLMLPEGSRPSAGTACL